MRLKMVAIAALALLLASCTSTYSTTHNCVQDTQTGEWACTSQTVEE